MSLCMVLPHGYASPNNCSCTPLVYEMKLNFSSSCPPFNVSVGTFTGIERLLCSISSTDSDTVDLTPISILSWRVIELNQALSILKVKTNINANLTDGSTFNFTSNSLSKPDVVTGGLQISLTGINAANRNVKLEVLVQYTNLCNTPPFENGSSLGWIIFERGTPPRPEKCYYSSYLPSSIPSKAPSKMSVPPSLRTKVMSVIPTCNDSIPPSKGKKAPKGMKSKEKNRLLTLSMDS